MEVDKLIHAARILSWNEPSGQSCYLSLDSYRGQGSVSNSQPGIGQRDGFRQFATKMAGGTLLFWVSYSSTFEQHFYTRPSPPTLDSNSLSKVNILLSQDQASRPVPPLKINEVSLFFSCLLDSPNLAFIQRSQIYNTCEPRYPAMCDHIVIYYCFEQCEDPERHAYKTVPAGSTNDMCCEGPHKRFEREGHGPCPLCKSSL